MEDAEEKESIFARDVVLTLLKVACRDNIGEVASREEQEESVGVVFREVLARIDFEKRTVNCIEYDVGHFTQGAINLASLALKFGIFLRSEGIVLNNECYFPRSDH